LLKVSGDRTYPAKPGHIRPEAGHIRPWYF
jgi:hypothetical protein